MVAEPLFSQQPRKLWIMSPACWVNRHSEAARPDVFLLWAAGARSGARAGVGGERRIAGASRTRAGESFSVSIVKTGRLKP